MSTNFQNPKNTPVTLNMKKAELTNIHVSQNVPQRSPMEVKIDGAVTCQIQLAQSVPMSSPLTWELVGDPGEQEDSGRRESERDHLLSCHIQESHGMSSERNLVKTSKLISYCVVRVGVRAGTCCGLSELLMGGECPEDTSFVRLHLKEQY